MCGGNQASKKVSIEAISQILGSKDSLVIIKLEFDKPRELADFNRNFFDLVVGYIQNHEVSERSEHRRQILYQIE